MIDVLTLIISSAVSVFSIIQTAKKADDDKKKAVSLLLSKIADIIDVSADELSNDKIPHGSCQTLLELAKQIPTVLSGLTTPEELDKLSTDLQHAYNIESLYGLNGDDKSYIDELYKAAGRFRAAAIMMDIK